MSRTLSMSNRCSGCRDRIADDSDMLVELDGACYHIDHVTLIGIKLRTGLFYGPYCNHECWDLDAQPGDKFVDRGRFEFTPQREEPV